jgi:hypothetical protein
MENFHHDHEKALTVNSAIHQGRAIGCSGRWLIESLSDAAWVISPQRLK